MITQIHSQRRYKKGRTVPKRAFLSKALNANTVRQSWQWSAIQPWLQITTPNNGTNSFTGFGGGAISLDNALGSSSTYYPPFCLFDITSTNNTTGTTSAGTALTITQYNPSFYPQFTGSGFGGTAVTAPSGLTFTKLCNQSPNGPNPGGYNTSGTSPWQALNLESITTAGASYPGQSCLLNSVQAKLMLYGASKYQTKFTIQLVQLKEDWLHPEFVSGILPNDNGYPYFNTAVAFWEWMTKPLVGNPIADHYSKNFRKMIKILKSKTVIISPKSTTESWGWNALQLDSKKTDGTYATGTYPNVSELTISGYVPPGSSNPQVAGSITTPNIGIGHTCQITFDMILNRKMNYRWAQDQVDPNLVQPLGLSSGTGSFVRDITENACVVRPKDRIYLLIKATNPEFTSATAESIGNTPSFDINLKINQTMLNN